MTEPSLLVVPPTYKLASRQSVYLNCVLKAEWPGDCGYYFVLKLEKDDVLCIEIIQVLDKQTRTYVWSHAAFAGCLEHYALYCSDSEYCLPPTFRFAYDDESGILCSGEIKLTVHTNQTVESDHHQSVVASDRQQSNKMLVCALCGKNNSVASTAGLLSHVVGDKWAHAFCLLYSPRRANESRAALIRRAENHKMRCSHCNRHGATIGCSVRQCRKNYHFLCLFEARAEWCDDERAVYCERHTAKEIEKQRVACRFPCDSGVQYRRENDWSHIAKADIDCLSLHQDAWEIYKPMWLHKKISSPLRVVEITSKDHWAYCEQLASAGARQYETVACRKIFCHEVLDEYTGTVRYLSEPQAKDNCYVARMCWPDDDEDDDDNKDGNKFFDRQLSALVVDAQRVGNETRYINSVSATTPPSVQQNARMETVWCRGKPRIIIVALRDIEDGEPIVVDYGADFFTAATDDNDDGDGDDNKLQLRKLDQRNTKKRLASDAVDDEHMCKMRKWLPRDTRRK